MNELVYIDLTAVRAGIPFSACLRWRFEIDNMFVTTVGSRDGMYSEPVAVTGLHVMKHKVVLIKDKSKCLLLLCCDALGNSGVWAGNIP